MAIKNDTMKTIKVFIASSEELKIERLEFTDMIQQLNRILKLYDIQIEPEKWEYLDYGNSTNWDVFYQWLSDTDFSLDENYEEIQAKIDLNNVVDYYLYELYSHNFDWPVNNVRCWQEGDGPWRFLFYDGDGCFSMDFDVLANATDTSNVVATLLFRKLIENESFVESFSNRLFELMTTHFLAENILPCYDSLCSLIEAEVPSQSERFAFPPNMDKWETDVFNVRSFILSLNQVTQVELADFLCYIGISEQSSTNLVYPNPFSDQLTVCINSAESKAIEVSMTNLLGQTVYRKTFALSSGSNTLTLNPALPEGVYVLKTDGITSIILCQP